MKELEINLAGQRNIGEVVVNVDDKPVKFKKNEFGNYVCKYQTENDKVNIKIFRMLDVGGVFWFITQIFFFLITIFGLFDVHHKERCMVIDFEVDVELKEENKILLQCNPPKENGVAVTIQTDLQGQAISNKYLLNTKAKKIRKGLLITKILLAIAIVVTIIVVAFVVIL